MCRNFVSLAAAAALALAGSSLLSPLQAADPVTGTAAPTSAPVEVSAPVVPPAVYKASCEGGFALAEGNTSNRIVTGLCNASREGPRWLLGFKGGLRYGENRFGGPRYPGSMENIRGGFLLTENNYAAALREDRFLTVSKSQYLYASEGILGDQFKGFWRRYDLQAGYGYAFLTEPDNKLRLEAGLQYNQDRLVAPNAHHSLTADRFGGVLTALGLQTLNTSVTLNERATWMPNLQDAKKDYRLEGELALAAKLSGRFSFKTAALVHYENAPQLIAPVDKTGAKDAKAPGPVPARKTDLSWTNLIVVSIF